MKWKEVIRFVITVLTAIAGALGCSIAFIN